MSKAFVAHETLVRAREADKKREADLRIEARHLRHASEKLAAANTEVLYAGETSSGKHSVLQVT